MKTLKIEDLVFLNKYTTTNPIKSSNQYQDIEMLLYAKAKGTEIEDAFCFLRTTVQLPVDPYSIFRDYIRPNASNRKNSGLEALFKGRDKTFSFGEVRSIFQDPENNMTATTASMKRNGLHPFDLSDNNLNNNYIKQVNVSECAALPFLKTVKVESFSIVENGKERIKHRIVDGDPGTRYFSIINFLRLLMVVHEFGDPVAEYYVVNQLAQYLSSSQDWVLLEKTDIRMAFVLASLTKLYGIHFEFGGQIKSDLSQNINLCPALLDETHYPYLKQEEILKEYHEREFYTFKSSVIDLYEALVGDGTLTLNGRVRFTLKEIESE